MHKRAIGQLAHRRVLDTTQRLGKGRQPLVRVRARARARAKAGAGAGARARARAMDLYCTRSLYGEKVVHAAQFQRFQ